MTAQVPPEQWWLESHPQLMVAPVQVSVMVVPHWPLHEAVLVQHAPSSPAPAACFGGPVTAHTRPPAHPQVNPVGSPGKRGKLAFASTLHLAPSLPSAGGICCAQVL